MRDLIHGPDFAALPFFNRANVVAWMEELEGADESERLKFDPVVYYLASLAVLQRHYVASPQTRPRFA